MQVIKVAVKPQKDRLDQFVSDSIKSLSRSQAKKLIKEGYILINNHPVDPAYKVHKSDKISVELPVSKEVSLKPEDIKLDILFEDDDLLVINKPAGIVVHPTLDHPTGTIVNALLYHLPNLADESLRPGIVHRLDKNTSGLLVIAKNEKSLENLKKQFKARTVSKEYLALVSGEVPKERGTIVGPIARHPKLKTKFIVDSSGKEAETEYRVLERFKNFSFLSLKPLTGRTHQLRVHLTHMGYPIVGDKLYGGKMLLNRQFLHAEKLSFKHPETKKQLTFESKLPKELEEFLAKLKV